MGSCGVAASSASRMPCSAANRSAIISGSAVQTSWAWPSGAQASGTGYLARAGVQFFYSRCRASLEILEVGYPLAALGSEDWCDAIHAGAWRRAKGAPRSRQAGARPAVNERTDGAPPAGAGAWRRRCAKTNAVGRVAQHCASVFVRRPSQLEMPALFIYTPHTNLLSFRRAPFSARARRDSALRPPLLACDARRGLSTVLPYLHFAPSAGASFPHRCEARRSGARLPFLPAN